MSHTSLCEVTHQFSFCSSICQILPYARHLIVSIGTLYTHMSDTSLCEASDLLVLLLCPLICQVPRCANYPACRYCYSVHLYVRYFAMRSIRLVSIITLFTRMSDTSLCEVSDLLVLVRRSLICQILRYAKYLTC